MIVKYSRGFLFFLFFSFCFSEEVRAFEVGVGTHFSSYSNSDVDNLNRVNQLGFTSIRDEILWQQVETKRRVYAIPPKISFTDAIFTDKRKSSSEINKLLILAYGNKLYIPDGGYPTNHNQIDAFAKYAKWIAERYKGKVKYYEIWNEWLAGTGVPNKKSKLPPNDLYIEMVAAVSKEIREVDPGAIILTGSINPLKEHEVDWMLDLISKGLLNYVDGISIHPYSFQFKGSPLQNPEGNFEVIDSFEEKLKVSSGRAVPIYITEIGIPTMYFHGGYSPERAGIDALKFFFLAKSRSYIKGVWWYDLIDDGESVFNREHHFGLFYLNGNAKPAALYLRDFMQLIKNADISQLNSGNKNLVTFNIIYHNKKSIVTWDRTQRDQSSQIMTELRSVRH